MSGDLEEMVPLLHVTDLDRSLRHYVDGLGFVMKNEWVDGGIRRWCWLSRGAVSIMLQLRKAGAPAETLGVGVHLCVRCGDAVALYHELRGRGVEAGEPFVGNRLWVTSVVDPDGYKMELSSPTDVPEETKLSELPALQK